MTLQEKLVARHWKKVKIQDDARIATLTPTPGMEEITDIAYIDDGHWGHLLDVYYPQGTTQPLPVIIDVHGGGFTYGDKDLNKLYNLYLASLGFTVFNLSYRIAPETRFDGQIKDVSAALHWIAAHGAEYPCDMENVFITGDSAGGLFAMLLPLIDRSPALQTIYGLKPCGLNFRAIGLVSPALTITKGAAIVLTKAVFGKGYRKWEGFRCLDMHTIPDLEQLPPCYLVTSKKDFVEKHSLEFAQILQKKGVDYELHDWPEGEKLGHVFSVLYPTMEESVQTSAEMTAFFRKYLVVPAENHA